MSFELIVDGNNSDVCCSDIILCSFFRVHLDGWSDLRRRYCKGGDEEV